jgi:hypothetical protein
LKKTDLIVYFTDENGRGKAAVMTAKDMDFLRERQRIGRKNLKRYWYTQSYRRIAGYRNIRESRREPDMLRARAVLIVCVAALMVAGAWSVLF